MSKTRPAPAAADWLVLALALMFGGASGAPLLAQRATLPPIRPLGPITATAKDSLKAIFGARVLSDGRIIVNDQTARRVVLFDSALTHGRAVIDSGGTAARTYPPRTTGMIYSYSGDSTLFYDPSAIALLVLDPAGKIARIVSPPSANMEINSKFGSDPRGRLVYTSQMAAIPGPPAAAGGPPAQRRPDSTLVLRIDLATRHLDTVAYVRTPKSYPIIRTTDADGFVWSTTVQSPIRVSDGWTLLPDGTIAVVRVQDYHVDWLAPDGTLTSSPKITHEWQRLSDSAKVAILDSAHKQNLAHPMGHQTQTINGVTKGKDIIAGLPPIEDVPDYAAPFSGVSADADGNLWIQEVTTVTADNGPVYELVNRAGVLFDRVQLPGGTTLVGFRPGVVYLSARTGAGVSLARARIH